MVHYFSENDFCGLVVDDFGQDGDGDLVLVNSHGVSVLLHDYNSPGGFNTDGRLDAIGIAFLFAAIRDPRANDLPLFDLNSDGQIDRSDMDYWVPQLRHARYGYVSFDGRVSFDDFLILSAHFGTTGASWSNGDYDGDTEDKLRGCPTPRRLLFPTRGSHGSGPGLQASPDVAKKLQKKK